MTVSDEDERVPRGLGVELEADRVVTALDETWAVVTTGPPYHDLQAFLRVRGDGGVDLLDRDLPFGAVTVREGRVPVAGYQADPWWRPRRRGRWLVVATPRGKDVGVMAFDGPESVRPSRAYSWPAFDRRTARGPARRLRSSGVPVEEQLAGCGYVSVARGADGLFEVYGNTRSPGLPMACRGPDGWHFLKPAGELWLWDPALAEPEDVPGAESRRRWAPEAERWLIPVGPVRAYRGTIYDLRLFHCLRQEPEKGGRMGDEFHQWRHPSDHFHHGPYMVATEAECRREDSRNRDWRGSLATLKWRKTGEWDVEP
ncbi:hypothetical protein ACQPZJ_11820 [Actinoplanes sp. CA-054009]